MHHIFYLLSNERSSEFNLSLVHTEYFFLLLFFTQLVCIFSAVCVKRKVRPTAGTEKSKKTINLLIIFRSLGAHFILSFLFHCLNGHFEQVTRIRWMTTLVWKTGKKEVICLSVHKMYNEVEKEEAHFKDIHRYTGLIFHPFKPET